MASSKCPKCENTYFEVKENSPSKSNFKMMFVQCSSCGTVIGSMDYYNIGTLIKDLEKKLGYGRSSDMNNSLDVINQNIGKLFRLLQDTNTRIANIENKSSK